MQPHPYRRLTWTATIVTLLSVCIFCAHRADGLAECLNETGGGSEGCGCPNGWNGPECKNCFKVMLPESNVTNSLSDGLGMYDDNMGCSWTLESSAKNATKATGRSVTLDFREFFTECSYDYVYVYEGDSIYSPMIAALTGVPSGRTITVNSSNVLVRFTSDLSSRRPGFSVGYSWSVCPRNCSGHGTCKDDGTCECAAEWKGSDCSVSSCPNQCNAIRGQGSCDTVKQVCACNSGFTGTDCSVYEDQPHWQLVGPQATGTMYQPDTAMRASHTIAVQDDVVWLFGGKTVGFALSNDLLRWNPITKEWAQVKPSGNAPSPRFGHTFTPAGNGTLLLFGGATDQSPSSDELWSYDTNQSKWSRLSPAPYGLSHHSAHFDTKTGTLVVLMGYSVDRTHPRTALHYRVATDSWLEIQPGGTTDISGGSQSSVYVPEIDAVVVYGGITATSMFVSEPTNTTTLYHIPSNQWYPLPAAPAAVYLHSAVAVGNLMYVYGGNGYVSSDEKYEGAQKCFMDVFLVFNLVTRQWLSLALPPDESPGNRYGHQMYLWNNTIHLHGGFDGTLLSDTRIYTPGNCSTETDQSQCETRGCYWCRKARVCQNPLESSTCEKPSLDAPATVSPTPACDQAYDCYTCNSLPGCSWDGSDTQRSSRTRCFVQDPNEPPANPQSCPKPCEAIDNCTTCVQAAGNLCVWCNSKRRCVRLSSFMETTPYGGCSQFAYADPSTCPAERCESNSNYSTCYAMEGCGWCQDPSNTGVGVCLQGTLTAPLQGSCPNNGTWFAESPPSCQCNGHSQCDKSGQCIGCHGNTTGVNCEMCTNGYFGDARNGGKCQKCPDRVNGHKCDECNRLTGGCLKCSGNVFGDQCNQCAPGYYGNPSQDSCKECNCNGQTRECNSTTGVCLKCPPGVVGDQCDQCADKYTGNPQLPGGHCYFPLEANTRYQVPMPVHTQRFFLVQPIRDDSDLNVTFTVTSPVDRSQGTVRVNMTIINPLWITSVPAPNAPPPVYLAQEHAGDFTVLLDRGSFRLTQIAVEVGVYTEGNLSDDSVSYQVAFTQYAPPPDLLRFFITFFACFFSLLLLAMLVWKVRMQWHHRAVREARQQELQTMAARPFASVNVLLPPAAEKVNHVVALEDTKEPGGVVATVLILLPTTRDNSHHHYAFGCNLISSQKGGDGDGEHIQSKRKRKFVGETKIRRIMSGSIGNTTDVN